MSKSELSKLGFGEGLARHLENYSESSPLGYRCQPPAKWRTSSLAQQPITALWECGTIFSHYHRGDGFFRVCSLEDAETHWCQHVSVQGLLAELFLDLYEDELSDDDLRQLSGDLGFHHIDALLLEASQTPPSQYAEWRKRFPLACDG